MIRDPYIGQRIICTAEGDWSYVREKDLPIELPVRDRIYTVRDVMKDSQGNTGIRLMEIHNKPIMLSDIKDYGEIAFSPDDFRPYREKETDISGILQNAMGSSAKH